MKRTIVLFSVLIAICSLFAGSLNEGFGSVVPPPAWQVINGGDSNTWIKYSGVLARTGGTCAYIYYSETAHDDWLITPQLLPSIGDATFSFWAFNGPGYTDRFNVKLSTASNNVADFTVSLATNVGPPNTWTLYTYDLSAYVWQTVFIAFQAISTNQSFLMIDDVSGPLMPFVDGFETNNFNYFQWNNSSASPWTVQNVEHYYGSYSAKSGTIDADSSTSLILSQVISAPGNIYFSAKVSSLSGSDFLKFYVDDVLKGSWSGETGWFEQGYLVTAGSHVFRWTYSKNVAGVVGSDCALLDNIVLPPISYATEANPVQITTPAQLNNIRNYLGSQHANKFFKLMNNIDLTTYLASGGEGYTTWGTAGWLPIGTNAARFYGHFNGNSKSISGLKIDRPANTDIGFFGNVAVGAVIENTRVATAAGSYVKGWQTTGMLVGYNDGTITNCSAVGSVYGQSDGCGVLVGAVGGSGTINRCFSKGTAIGAAYRVGGLAGQNYGTISNCYSRATVTGQHYLGGLVGYQGSGTINNSFATGLITGGSNGGLLGNLIGGTIVNSYWDVQTTGLSYSQGSASSYGKTTAQMKMQSTYPGWDFYGETANGTNDYWGIFPTDFEGYPCLIWDCPNYTMAPLQNYPNDGSLIRKTLAYVGWDANTLGQVPFSYMIYMIPTNPAHLTETGYPRQITYSAPHGYYGNPYNLNEHPENIVNYGETWYWKVVAYDASGVAYSSPIRSFTIENDPFGTESFEYSYSDGSTTIPNWEQGWWDGPLESATLWKANSTHTDFNRAPRTGAFNLTLFNAGFPLVSTVLARIYPLVAGRTYEIEVYARQDTPNPADAGIRFYTLNSPMTELSPMYGLTNGSYQRFTCTFTAAQTHENVLYYVVEMNDNANYVSIDDITVREVLTLETPQLTISKSGTDVTLTWDDITYASEYRVYTSDNPATWTSFITVASPTHTYTFDSVGVGKKFYRVVASTIVRRD